MNWIRAALKNSKNLRGDHSVSEEAKNSQEEKSVSRRSFLKKGAAIGGAALLAGSGMSSLQAAEMSTEKEALYMDHSLCVSCHACRVACQNENNFPNEANTVEIRGVETGSYPDVDYYTARISCFHCRNAPCVEICPADAIEPARGDFKVTDNEACIGCYECLDVCPFDVPEFVPEYEEESMFKCDGCLHLLEQEKEPACVDTCPTDAISFGTQKEMAQKGMERIKQLESEGKTGYLFGPETQGGLGLMLVLRTDPRNFDLS